MLEESLRAEGSRAALTGHRRDAGATLPDAGATLRETGATLPDAGATPGQHHTAPAVGWASGRRHARRSKSGSQVPFAGGPIT